MIVSDEEKANATTKKEFVVVEKVKLVKLNNEQIQMAKKENGARKLITHAVVCNEYGQLFGTEKQCRKYYSAWSSIFPELFSGGEELNSFSFDSFKTTPELVMKLIDAQDQQEESSVAPRYQHKSKGFWAKLFGR